MPIGQEIKSGFRRSFARQASPGERAGTTVGVAQQDLLGHQHAAVRLVMLDAANMDQRTALFSSISRIQVSSPGTPATSSSRATLAATERHGGRQRRINGLVALDVEQCAVLPRIGLPTTGCRSAGSGRRSGKPAVGRKIVRRLHAVVSRCAGTSALASGGQYHDKSPQSDRSLKWTKP